MEKIKSFLANKYLLAACRILIGGVFVLASTGKIIFPHDFARDVYSYMMMPAVFVPAFAAILPWIEFSAGLLLLADIKPKSSAVIVMGLLVMFIAAILYTVANGIEISCGCFDILFPEEKAGWSTIIRDLIMMIIIAPVLFFDHNNVRIYGLLNKND